MLDFILIIALFLSSFYLLLEKMSRQNGSKDKYGSTGEKKKAMFITGCDSGFGYSLILHHLENFDDNNIEIIIAGCYFPCGNSEGADKLKQYAKEIGRDDVLHVLKLDVTKDESVNDARIEIDRILTQANCVLWAVVNNAAALVFADAVFQTNEQARNQINVNLYGLWSISKTFAPHLMQAKGRLVNIVSFCTECPLPTLSLYTATKAGVLSLSEGMRMELARFGVDVILFNPGDCPNGTPLCSGQKRNYEDMAKDINNVYKENSLLLDYFNGCEKKFTNNFPRPALQKIDSPGLYTEFDKIIKDPNPQYAYVNSDMITRSFFGVLRILPRKWSDAARLALMRLPK